MLFTRFSSKGRSAVLVLRSLSSSKRICRLNDSIVSSPYEFNESIIIFKIKILLLGLVVIVDQSFVVVHYLLMLHFVVEF